MQFDLHKILPFPYAMSMYIFENTIFYLNCLITDKKIFVLFDHNQKSSFYKICSKHLQRIT